MVTGRKFVLAFSKLAETTNEHLSGSSMQISFETALKQPEPAGSRRAPARSFAFYTARALIRVRTSKGTVSKRILRFTRQGCSSSRAS